jgi:hypothetical protein
MLQCGGKRGIVFLVEPTQRAYSVPCSPELHEENQEPTYCTPTILRRWMAADGKRHLPLQEECLQWANCLHSRRSLDEEEDENYDENNDENYDENNDENYDGNNDDDEDEDLPEIFQIIIAIPIVPMHKIMVHTT